MGRTDWLDSLLLDTARPRSTEGGVLRFVEDEDYAGSFGREWNWFSTTQLDRGGDDESHTTFVQKTGLSPEELEGKTVLDAGCGMGRFADVVSAHGAKVVGIDLSAAVDAAQRNLGGRENVAIMQASLFDLPLRDASFDLVYSIGVLHHTPDTRAAFDALTRLVKPGGTLAVWVYSRELRERIYSVASDFYRRWTVRMDHERLLRWSRRVEPLGRLYGTRYGVYLSPLLPVPHHPKKEWRILDTFDWYSPRYQWKHRWHEVEEWFRSAGFVQIRRNQVPVSVAGERPAAPPR